jgi:hypothetical protein
MWYTLLHVWSVVDCSIFMWCTTVLMMFQLWEWMRLFREGKRVNPWGLQYLEVA